MFTNQVMLEHYLDLTIRLVSVISRTLIGMSHPFVEMQSVYSTAPADWASALYAVKYGEYKCTMNAIL